MTKILIAKIIRAQGIKGEVRIKFYTNDYNNLLRYGIFTDKSNKAYVIKASSVRDSNLVVKFEGIDNRNDSESIIGLELYIDEENLNDNMEDEFYHFQLIDIEVYIDSNLFGNVKAVHNFGAGDILEIALINGGNEFFSFTKEVVTEINLAKNYIVICLQEEI